MIFFIDDPNIGESSCLYLLPFVSHRPYLEAKSGMIIIPRDSTNVSRKIPWRISANRKFRHRSRMRNVDAVVDTVSGALARLGLKTKAVERWRVEMPTEAQMRPKDKYTMFSRYAKTYRKGIHSKWSER
jgi:hypothetical protein